MIYPLTGLVLGAIIGAFRARAKEGNGKDIAQWAAVHGMVFFVLGMFVLIAVDRLFY